MKVRVPINGRPSPEVQWMKNGTLVEANERISFEQDDTSATMLVRNCSRGDVGTYCIKIRNYMGFDEASFPVNVTDRPGSVSNKPQVLDVTDSSCVVTWSPSSDDGGSPILEYIVEECEKVAGRWKLAGSTTFNRITVTGLKKNSQYAFRVKARNVYGTSEESQASDWARIKMTSCQNFDYDKFGGNDNDEDVDHDLDKLNATDKNVGNNVEFRGQFGMMHRVIEKSTDRNYLVRFSMSTSAEKLLMRREVDITNLLTHQHQSLHHRHQCGIIYLHDAFETDGEIAFVYEFLSGPDLITKLLNVGHTEVRIINYMRQICQAVAFMHVNDIVNLDIRPETIFFTTSKSENLKLTNFGTSQKLDPDRSVRVVYPSISFCPPELLTFEPVSFYSDVWNLGVLAYLLVSGTQLFESAELDEAYNRITSHDEVAFNEDTWTDVSNYCQNWISRCLRREPVKRMSMVEALAHPWLNVRSTFLSFLFYDFI
ncbi:hypothetical protein HELRODRAFT_76196 [Helobdella robusta]|uniref:Protein kinase domain-containing protein n=1 Tax=Helobdella robusta TaxID=6412 RepID=T1G2G6_HELRO|nr:hypothetical protein HELRODRAFT_76196 [Helobdella robusta]ESO07595.1 hypothetical protein HELRODRAFT_76196 [Helobdella robusta]